MNKLFNKMAVKNHYLKQITGYSLVTELGRTSLFNTESPENLTELCTLQNNLHMTMENAINITVSTKVCSSKRRCDAYSTISEERLGLQIVILT